MSAPARLDLAARARLDPGGVALIDERGEVTTWAALAARAAAAAATIAAAAAGQGLAPTDPVSFVAHARPSTFVTLHALIAAGRPFVPLHPRLDVGAAAALAASLGAGDPLPAESLDPLAGRDDPAARLQAPLRPAPADDARPLAILATSGTSAAPKGVVLSRRAFVAAADASAANLPLSRDARWLACMPLAHAGGLSIVTRALAAGAGVVLLPRFDPGAVLAAVRDHRVTHLSAVPTMLRALLDDPGRGALASVRAVLVGGAASPVAWLAEARSAGIAALATYGLTEACSQVATQPLADAARAPTGDSGAPLPGVEVGIRAPDGTAAGPGDEGEILVRGPTLLTRYVGESPRAPGAWHATGDFGVLRPDGRLVVLARRTDLIVTGGENVAPAALEAELSTIAGVHEVVVFGVADPRWGERVAAVVVLAPGADLAPRLAAVATRLPPHARPRLALAVEGPLPRTPKGEVDRAAARARWASALRPVGA